MSPDIGGAAAGGSGGTRGSRKTNREHLAVARALGLIS